MSTVIKTWPNAAIIQRNNFINKSLSCFAFNIAVGCAHACRFCYVPDASTNKLGPKLKEFGVSDPDAEWGDYALLRTWDKNAFLASLRRAENTPADQLNPDGNRALMLCTTTDPYQVVGDQVWNKARQALVREALTLIRDNSTLNVRILTRSPLAREDFDLFKTFGNRLLFGMSLPTLNNKLAMVYEPKAPAPSKRLETLQRAREAGLHVYVAMAPTYPECDTDDLCATLRAIGSLEPVTIFHEPINIRSQNVARIQEHASKLGVELDTHVFSHAAYWRTYALEQLYKVEGLAKFYKFSQIHLWPDKSLGSKAAVEQAAQHAQRSAEYHMQWLQKWWNRISEWPQQNS